MFISLLDLRKCRLFGLGFPSLRCHMLKYVVVPQIALNVALFSSNVYKYNSFH